MFSLTTATHVLKSKTKLANLAKPVVASKVLMLLLTLSLKSAKLIVSKSKKVFFQTSTLGLFKASRFSAPQAAHWR